MKRCLVPPPWEIAMTASCLRFAPAALLAVLLSTGAAADHPGQAGRESRLISTAIPVDAMAPGIRAAYLAGIHEELAAHGYDPRPLDAADGIASKALLDHLKFALPKVYAGRALPGDGRLYQAAPPRPAVPLMPRVPQIDEGPGPWPGEVTSEPLPDLPEAIPPEAALPPVPPPTPPPEAAPEPAPTIGGVVSQVQAALKRRGYYAGRVTGRFDPETSAAVRRFQADNGLAVDGVINTALLNALERPEAQPQGGIPAPPPAGESRDI
jgi:hypothetical protein